MNGACWYMPPALQPGKRTMRAQLAGSMFFTSVQPITCLEALTSFQFLTCLECPGTRILRIVELPSMEPTGITILELLTAMDASTCPSRMLNGFIVGLSQLFHLANA